MSAMPGEKTKNMSALEGGTMKGLQSVLWLVCVIEAGAKEVGASERR